MEGKVTPFGNNPLTKKSDKPWKPMSLKEVLGSKKDLTSTLGSKKDLERTIGTSK